VDIQEAPLPLFLDSPVVLVAVEQIMAVKLQQPVPGQEVKVTMVQ
jgi:hypothetical protein